MQNIHPHNLFIKVKKSKMS